MTPHGPTGLGLTSGASVICARQDISDDESRQYFALARPADGTDHISLSAMLFDDAYVDWLAGGAMRFLNAMMSAYALPGA